jgi:hypothetical protein
MFEYKIRSGRRTTINPKMITVILEDSDNMCKIYTTDGEDPLLIDESYEKVRDDFNSFMYSINTIVSVR